MPYKDPAAQEAYFREYRIKNRERIRASCKATYQRNREVYIARADARRRERGDEFNEVRRTARALKSATGKCTARARCSSDKLPELEVCALHWFERVSLIHKLGGLSAVPMLQALWEAQGGICPLTGETLVMGSRHASLDHIVPIGRGGTSDPSNLRFVVQYANWMKADGSDAELLERCRTIVAALTRPG